MIRVKNFSGLGNKIKNIISALRLSDLRGDALTIDFDYKNLFSIEHAPQPKLPREEILSTWGLLHFPEDRWFSPLRERRELLDEYNNNFHVMSTPDHQYENYSIEFIKLYSFYFSKIKWHPVINETIEKISKQIPLEDAIGIHVRTWSDAENRRRQLFDVDSILRVLGKHDDKRPIFLSSDDEHFFRHLKTLVPEGRCIFHLDGLPVAHTAKTNDEDVSRRVVLELLILAKCKDFIGSYISTFSECVWWLGGNKNNVLIPIPSSINKMAIFLNKDSTDFLRADSYS